MSLQRLRSHLSSVEKRASRVDATSLRRCRLRVGSCALRPVSAVRWRHVYRKINPCLAKFRQERHKRPQSNFPCRSERSLDRFVIRVYKWVAPNGALIARPVRRLFNKPRRLLIDEPSRQQVRYPHMRIRLQGRSSIGTGPVEVKLAGLTGCR